MSTNALDISDGRQALPAKTLYLFACGDLLHRLLLHKEATPVPCAAHTTIQGSIAASSLWIQRLADHPAQRGMSEVRFS